MQDKIQEGEKVMLEAQSMITSVFGERTPLAVKYNLHLLEAYDRREEGPERTDLLFQISNRNLEIVKEIWGKDHFFTIRVQLTAYLACMTTGDGEKTADIYEDMTRLKYNGDIILLNRYIFKAKMHSILILM